MSLWTEAEDNILRDNMGKFSYRDIQKRFLPNRTLAAIQNRLAFKDLWIFERGKNPQSSEHSRFKCNEDFFGVPNILNSYWAGFIAADGNIRKDTNTLRIK